MIDRRPGLVRRWYALVAAAAVLIAGCNGNDSGEAADTTPGPSTTPSISASPSPVEPTTPSPSSLPSDTAESAQASQIDSCLLGRWRQTSMTQLFSLDDANVEANGWTGRVLEFRPDGTEVVEYDDASPVTADGPAGQYTEEWSGVAVYEVTTSGDTLSFPSVDFSDTIVVWQYGDEGGEEQPSGTSAPVTYTCDDTTHTQRSESYEAEFTRISR